MKKIVLQIDGMMCSMCEAHINDALRAAFKIKKVTSSHKTGQSVILSETDIPDGELYSALEKTGYRLISISRPEDENEKKGMFGFLKKSRL